MQVKLYQTQDAANVINKTLTGERIIDVALRRDFNLFSPEVVLKMANAGEALAFNYAIIHDLEKRYFVDNVENVGAKRWRYTLSVDVLETYKNDVLNSKARFKRNIKTGDYLDAYIDMNVNKVSSTFESNKGFEGEPSLILTTVGA